MKLKIGIILAIFLIIVTAFLACVPPSANYKYVGIGAIDAEYQEYPLPEDESLDLTQLENLYYSLAMKIEIINAEISEIKEIIGNISPLEMETLSDRVSEIEKKLGIISHYPYP